MNRGDEINGKSGAVCSRVSWRLDTGIQAEPDLPLVINHRAAIVGVGDKGFDPDMLDSKVVDLATGNDRFEGNAGFLEKGGDLGGVAQSDEVLGLIDVGEEFDSALDVAAGKTCSAQ